VVYLIRVAPGAGVILIDATQRPSGIGSGGEVAKRFTAFRDLHQIRFSLRTPEWRVSEMVLGAGALGEGVDSSKLLPEYKGVGILRGATDANPTVRCFLADHKDAEKILLAARGLRERAGTLSGMALGEDVGVPARDVLGDVLVVFGAEAWEDATAESVSADVRGQGVPSVDVKMYGRALKGCRKADVERVSRS